MNGHGNYAGMPRYCQRSPQGDNELSAQLLTAFGTASVDDIATANRRHTRAEAVTAGADNFTGLVRTFHDAIPDITLKGCLLYAPEK
jgi:hypothetical protein